MSDTSNADSIDLVQDFKNLHATIVDDIGGDKVRELIKYFDESVARSQQVVQTTKIDLEREFATLLQEAFAASKRIVTGTWELVHGASLA
jgi:hypothetical protein